MSELDDIRARVAATTEGPWHWAGYKNRYSGMGPYIATWIPGHGRCTVMDTCRLGMQGAQPRFRNPAGTWGMKQAVELAVREVDYRDDIVDVDHPDARFLVSARKDVLFLLGELDRLHAQRADDIGELPGEGDELDQFQVT